MTVPSIDLVEQLFCPDCGRLRDARPARDGALPIHVLIGGPVGEETCPACRKETGKWRKVYR